MQSPGQYPPLPSEGLPSVLSLDQIRTQRENPHGVSFEQPSATVMTMLQRDDPRVDIIHGREQVDGHDLVGELGRPSSDIKWDGWYDLLMSHAIAERLDIDFADLDGIPIRSIQASLDGTVTNGLITVHDIRTILNLGETVQSGVVNLAGFKPGEAGMPFRVSNRVIQYAANTGEFRYQDMERADGVDRIFPFLLVYDKTMLQQADLGAYGYKIPEDPASRSRVILKAYALDAMVRYTN